MWLQRNTGIHPHSGVLVPDTRRHLWQRTMGHKIYFCLLSMTHWMTQGESVPISESPAPIHEEQKIESVFPSQQGWLFLQGLCKDYPSATSLLLQSLWLFLPLPLLILIFLFPNSMLQSNPNLPRGCSTGFPWVSGSKVWDCLLLVTICRINNVNMTAGPWVLGQISILQWVSFHSTGVLNVNRHFSPGAFLCSLQHTSSGGTFHWKPIERLLLFSFVFLTN